MPNCQCHGGGASIVWQFSVAVNGARSNGFTMHERHRSHYVGARLFLLSARAAHDHFVCRTLLSSHPNRFNFLTKAREKNQRFVRSGWMHRQLRIYSVKYRWMTDELQDKYWTVPMEWRERMEMDGRLFFIFFLFAFSSPLFMFVYFPISKFCDQDE